MHADSLEITEQVQRRPMLELSRFAMQISTRRRKHHPGEVLFDHERLNGELLRGVGDNRHRAAIDLLDQVQTVAMQRTQMDKTRDYAVELRDVFNAARLMDEVVMIDDTISDTVGWLLEAIATVLVHRAIDEGVPAAQIERAQEAIAYARADHEETRREALERHYNNLTPDD